MDIQTTEHATIEQLQAQVVFLELRLNAAVDENNALKAQPSSLFKPQSPWQANQQYERDAFAKGLHHAATTRRGPVNHHAFGASTDGTTKDATPKEPV